MRIIYIKKNKYLIKYSNKSIRTIQFYKNFVAIPSNGYILKKKKRLLAESILARADPPTPAVSPLLQEVTQSWLWFIPHAYCVIRWPLPNKLIGKE
jgi:hypothetical protein